MSESKTARLVGVNHVALVVGDVDEALSFYDGLFEFDLRGRSNSKAFLDMGDQFLALAEGDGARERSDEQRHFGVVVDDATAVERRLQQRDVDRLDTSGLDFLDPWGNRIQIVEYESIQYTKPDHVLDGMGLSDLDKTDAARQELAEKGLSPE